MSYKEKYNEYLINKKKQSDYRLYARYIVNNEYTFLYNFISQDKIKIIVEQINEIVSEFSKDDLKIRINGYGDPETGDYISYFEITNDSGIWSNLLDTGILSDDVNRISKNINDDVYSRYFNNYENKSFIHKLFTETKSRNDILDILKIILYFEIAYRINKSLNPKD